MGIRIKNNGAQGLKIKFERIAEKSTRAAREGQRILAEETADIARQMAPELTGELERGIQIKRRRETPGASTLEVGVYNVDHAVYMHEGVYELGPISEVKNATSPYKVGRKFLSRALGYVKRDPRNIKLLAEHIRRSLRGF